MNLFEVTLTLSIEAMHEESADTKLDNFLSALDLKKNEKIDLVDLGDLVSVGEEGTTTDSEEGKKKLPDLKMPEEDWEDEWEELDWDSLDEEDPEEDPEEDEDTESEQ